MNEKVKDRSALMALLRQPIIACCLVTLALLTFLAIAAYAIAPDNTINANRQIPSMSLKYPGQHQEYLVIPRSISETEDKGLFQNWISGYQDLHEYIPYDSITVVDDKTTIHYKSAVQILDQPSAKVDKKSMRHYAGTDTYGRDVLSRLILGLRVSLLVGFLSVAVSIFLGLLIGTTAGYYGGKVDKILMLLINTSWSIPTILMAFAVIIAVGKGLLGIVLAIGLTMWVDVARILRGQVLQIKEELYIKAGQTLGLSRLKVIVKHIIPNLYGTLSVMSASNFATAILVEAGLSFLGLGIQPPSPSLGNMLKEGYAFATGGFVYLAFFPIITIMILVLSFNLIGTALRDINDVKTANR